VEIKGIRSEEGNREIETPQGSCRLPKLFNNFHYWPVTESEYHRCCRSLCGRL